ncbi:hypothetical protein GCM10025857_17390 [Alicyclobacillus contaminans]|nr:hypothetical protein GCM10025857_17390 [Alicyclobacillus contaminans]
MEHALQAIGFADYLEGDAALLIEWPEAVRDLVADALSIEMVAQPLPRVDERVLHCTTTGWRSLNLLDEWVKRWLF